MAQQPLLRMMYHCLPHPDCRFQYGSSTKRKHYRGTRTSLTQHPFGPNPTAWSPTGAVPPL